MHRLVWELKHGPIPNGLTVCHRCDVRTCINVDHLFLGTNADNVADMVAKKRHRAPQGADHGMAKLNAHKAREIYLSQKPAIALAEEYGIADTTLIYKIWARQNWLKATEDLPLRPRSTLSLARQRKATLRALSA